MYDTGTRLKQEALLLNDFYIDPIAIRSRWEKQKSTWRFKEFELLYFFVSKKGDGCEAVRNSQHISTSGQLNKDGAVNVEICRLRKENWG